MKPDTAPHRAEVMKVFGIGLGKTGTTSLASAMRTLGFKSKHAPRYVDQIEDFEFANDISVAWRFRFLDHVYPRAKFILTVRDLRGWLASCRNYDAGKKGKTPLRRLENRFLCYGRTNFEEVAFEMAYTQHVDAVRAHFNGRPEKLLVLDICRGEGWEKLCPFLGFSIPEVPFPHKNVHKPTTTKDECRDPA